MKLTRLNGKLHVVERQHQSSPNSWVNKKNEESSAEWRGRAATNITEARGQLAGHGMTGWKSAVVCCGTHKCKWSTSKRCILFSSVVVNRKQLLTKLSLLTAIHSRLISTAPKTTKSRHPIFRHFQGIWGVQRGDFKGIKGEGIQLDSFGWVPTTIQDWLSDELGKSRNVGRNEWLGMTAGSAGRFSEWVRRVGRGGRRGESISNKDVRCFDDANVNSFVEHTKRIIINHSVPI